MVNGCSTQNPKFLAELKVTLELKEIGMIGVDVPVWRLEASSLIGIEARVWSLIALVSPSPVSATSLTGPMPSV